MLGLPRNRSHKGMKGSYHQGKVMSRTSKCLGTEQVQHVGFPEDNMPQNLPLEEFALGIQIVSPCMDKGLA